MTPIDLLLPLRLDTPPGNPDALDATLRRWLAQPPSTADASLPGVWQPQRTDLVAAATAHARPTGGAYVESSRDLQRGLEVIEWHHAPSPGRTAPRPSRR